MPDAGLGAAGRRARPSVRRRDGERLSRTERPGDPIPVEGEPQADPDRAPTRTRVPQGEPPGRGGAAVRCRCQVASRGVGFGLPGTPRVAPGVPANSIAKHQISLLRAYTLPRAAPLISGVANEWFGATVRARGRYARSLSTPSKDRQVAVSSTMSAAFSPIIIDGALVLPDVSVGMIEASAIRRPAMPWTRSWASTTAIGSDPILQVPTGW